MGVLPLLISVIQKYRNNKFKWGEFDCALFVANVLYDLYGVDYAGQLRGTYDTEIGSHRALKQWGGLTGFLDQTFHPIDINYAQRGDIVMVPPRSVGICTGRRVACVTERDGIAYIPMRQGVSAWRVSA